MHNIIQIFEKNSVFYFNIYNHLQKILEKLRKLKKSCDHKQNISKMYDEKLHYILPPTITNYKT